MTKKTFAWTLLTLFLLFFPVTVQAIPAAPGGLRAAVVFSAGIDQEINIRFDLASDDPDQDTGSWDYNVSIDQGSGFVDLGPASGLSDFESGGGQQSATIVLGGASAVTDIKIHAWDGADEGADSCTVQVDSGVLYDYDACGELDTAFTQQDCLPISGSSSGFHYEQNVNVADERIVLQHLGPGDTIEQWGIGALNRGGDTASQRLDFTVRAAVDGAVSESHIFWSEVNLDASIASRGNTLNTGSFANGWEARIVESGNDWDLTIFHVQNGARNSVATRTLTDAIDANIFTTGYFELDPYADSIIFSLGNEVVGLAPNYTTADRPTTLYSLWILEKDLVNTDSTSATSYQRIDGLGAAAFCISSGPVEKGGGTAIAVGGQPLEDFGGEGGFGGDPQFPGLDVESFSNSIGISDTALAGALAGVMIIGFTVTGLWVAGTFGASAGAIIGTGLSAILNLLQLWIIVVIFLIAVAFIALRMTSGGGGE